MMKYKARACELCGHEGFLHCAADSAFLCFDCDARVHQANFLVARHVRQNLCSQCKCLTGKFISGERSLYLSQPICPSCSDENPFDAETIMSCTKSSDCSSSTESATATIVKKAIRPSASNFVSGISREISGIPPRFLGEISSKKMKREKMAASEAEGVFVIWCNRMGLSANSVVPSAYDALELCLKRSTVLPFRVCLASSFWLGLRMCGAHSLGTWQNLRRLETVSAVPAKLIMAVETRLARVMALRRRSRKDLEEGWAECSV